MICVKEPIPGVIYPPRARLRAYVEAGELPLHSLAGALCESFERNASRIALYLPQGTLSYRELDDRTSRLAAALLDLGLAPTDRAIFQSANSGDLVIALLGCLKAGLIPVCTLAGHREKEIGYLGCHADARVHFVQGDDPKFDLPAFALQMRSRIPTMQHIVALGGERRDGLHRMEDLIAGQDGRSAHGRISGLPRDPFQVAIFQLSGGTTGVPKIIPRMQNDYLLNAMLTAQRLGYGGSDVMFMPMPMMHNACMICFLLPTLLTGAAFVIPADMTPESWLRAFHGTRPTWVGLIRALLPRYDAMLELDPAANASVRAFWAPDAAAVVRRKYGVVAHALFGMAEGMNMYTHRDDPEQARDETVGLPLSHLDEVRLVEPGTDREIAIDETGELTCRGPYTLAGYYNAPERNREAFSADGFYRTGDLVVRREIEGRYFYAFAGRTKDVVDRGTEKISCEEVEQLLMAHAAVSDVAVVGMPDPVLGERACAYVVVKPGLATPSVSEFAEFLRGAGLARFKWPERVECIDALPLTKVGKVDKSILRSRIKQTLATPPTETLV